MGREKWWDSFMGKEIRWLEWIAWRLHWVSLQTSPWYARIAAG
jgi:hypothetical protein